MWWPLRRHGHDRWTDLISPEPEPDQTTTEAAALAAELQAEAAAARAALEATLGDTTQLLPTVRPLMTPGQEWRSRMLL